MVRQGWLAPVRLAGRPGLCAHPARRTPARRRRRAHLPHPPRGLGRHLAPAGRPPCPTERSRRDRLRAGLTFLGYAQLDDATWIGPRWSEEVDLLLETEGVRAERFLARHDGDSLGLVRRAWDIEGLARAYGAVAGRRRAGRAATPTTDPGDEQAFATRSQLVHEWRKFLFLDPGLPRELLPVPWAGERGRRLLRRRERAAAGRPPSRFVDQLRSTDTLDLTRSPPRSKEGLHA